MRKIIGKQIQQVEPGAEILNVLNTKAPIIKEKQYIKTLDKYVSVHIFPIEREGKLEAVASVFNDSTDVVKLGQEIEKANEIAMSYKRQAEAEQELSKLEIHRKKPSLFKICFTGSDCC